ncbi:UDP-N-acetylmuramate--L-alanine ligase [Spirochaeta thermophila DSM 6578]|uniref:UDP-N-acetylmuramate--L-alanine ligase n=1 Tax=Winmispira thermophila (strain ATCC 700085 / DSM 6578 / Z-1203) TaxID=869211 RepID=G0GFB3_WINT7|nr:UDP-N-acetylmuramate--L-alanine ligase [Spirochaeta thermophila]AEJ61527.1 UDP-N-acetylmuramate--L-alanine ligase [Spirochaeta thermophila DSM 6578]
MELFSPEGLASARLFFVGIKGTGMTALAELFSAAGAVIEGSDVDDTFYTDEILASLGIRVHDFSHHHLHAPWHAVVHSAAYPPTHPQLAEARRLGIPCYPYPHALGAYSRHFRSAGIAGVHGKTSTTALTGTLLRALSLPAATLTGSAVPLWGGRATLTHPSPRYFVAETCEYRRHFLHFNPTWIVLTSVEEDHLDYYPTYEDIFAAFLEYAHLLPPDGALIYCADQPGAVQAARTLAAERPDLALIPYGRTAPGPFRITDISQHPGAQTARLAAGLSFTLHVPGAHMLLNATAALALTALIAQDAGLAPSPEAFLSDHAGPLCAALASYTGTRRRSEVVGQAGGIIFIDDYGHHPTAIRATLEGYRTFYPGRRIILDFMSHTYSRTAALLHEFARSFEPADIVILHKIYASARETSGAVTGEDLYRAASAMHPFVYYTHEVMDAFDLCTRILRPGDLFITMGAGDNWKLGRALYQHYANKEGAPTCEA